jgi:F0F1-type ATP synthase assembly protein I
MYDKSGWICMIAFLLIGMTFGVWKIIEMCIWLFTHIHISVG